MSGERKKPWTPVKPSGMELIFLYRCPACGRQLPLIAPTRPTKARCESCGESFPIAPVDDKGVATVKLLMGDGAAACNPDFL